MIAADSSSFIAFMQRDEANDTARIQEAIEERLLVFPPPVLSELLSDPTISLDDATYLCAAPLVPLLPDYWQRTGQLRALLIAKKLKARLADALIAQCCIDNDVPLITRDADFRHYASHGGLTLLG